MAIKANNSPAEIVTLVEAKSHLRVLGTEEDSLITTYLLAAIAWAGGFCHRVFSENAYTLTAPDFDFELENPPVTAIASIKYKADGDSDYTTITNTNYRLNEDGIKPCVEFIEDYELENVGDAVEVIFTAGFTTNTLPDNVKVAVLLKLSSLYDNREDSNKRFETTAENLLMKHKIFSI